ncbi:MAG: VOC family protein [Ilumatobacteraceae bacterium]
MAVHLTKDSIDLGIVVSDGAAALAFYRDTLGIPDTGETMLMPGGGTMYRLQCGSSLLKLVAPGTAPTEHAVRGGITAATGHRYVTLTIDNLEEVTAACAEAGYAVIVPIREARPGITISMVEDPDGNIVELLQRT